MTSPKVIMLIWCFCMASLGLSAQGLDFSLLPPAKIHERDIEVLAFDAIPENYVKIDTAISVYRQLGYSELDFDHFALKFMRIFAMQKKGDAVVIRDRIYNRSGYSIHLYGDIYRKIDPYFLAYFITFTPLR